MLTSHVKRFCAALKRLKRNKAAGADGIKAEFILDAAELLLTPLVMTFNQVLQRGVPASWCVGGVHPNFQLKAGYRDDPGKTTEVSRWLSFWPSCMPWC